MWCQLTELENAFPSLGNLNPPTTAKSGNSSRSKHALPHAVTIKHCRSCEHFFVLGSNPFNLRLLGSISLSQSCAPPWALLCTSHIPTAQTALWVSARSPLYPVNPQGRGRVAGGVHPLLPINAFLQVRTCKMMFSSWFGCLTSFTLPFSGYPGRVILFCLLYYFHEVCRESF